MAAANHAPDAVGPDTDDELTVVRMLEAQEVALRHQLDLVKRRIQEQEEATKAALQEVNYESFYIIYTFLLCLVMNGLSLDYFFGLPHKPWVMQCTHIHTSYYVCGLSETPSNPLFQILPLVTH